MTDLRLSQIYVYPVKSLRGIALEATELTAKGPKRDRRWLLVDRDGIFLTQREVGAMALLQPSLEMEHLRITDLRGDREDLLIPLEVDDPPSARTAVEIWNDRCEAALVSDQADWWFSQALNVDCRLVYMPDGVQRPIDPAYAKGKETVSFADGYPYLILGEASMADLNRRLSEPIEVIRFRPNLVFSGGTPFMEDDWRDFRIGSAQFRGTKPCARCQIPTIDLNTGTTSKEPTRTLATFRKQEHKILFGLNACWDLNNTEAGKHIRLGDPVKIS